MQLNFVNSTKTRDASTERRATDARAPSQPELTGADYDRMSRAARRVSTNRSVSFMDAFKKANPEWSPNCSKLG